MALLIPMQIVVFVELWDCLWLAFGNTQGGAGLSQRLHWSSVSALALREMQLKGLMHMCAWTAQHGATDAYGVEGFICSFGYTPRYKFALTFAGLGSDHYQLSKHRFWVTMS